MQNSSKRDFWNKSRTIKKSQMLVEKQMIKVCNITGGQHCRAEFYVDGLGWVPTDPADVTKK